SSDLGACTGRTKRLSAEPGPRRRCDEPAERNTGTVRARTRVPAFRAARAAGRPVRHGPGRPDRPGATDPMVLDLLVIGAAITAGPLHDSALNPLPPARHGVPQGLAA